MYCSAKRVEQVEHLCTTVNFRRIGLRSYYLVIIVKNAVLFRDTSGTGGTLVYNDKPDEDRVKKLLYSD